MKEKDGELQPIPRQEMPEDPETEPCADATPSLRTTPAAAEIDLSDSLGAPGPEEHQRRLAEDRQRPDFSYLVERIDPTRWGWNSLAEWLVDQSGLIEQRPAHLGRIRFEQDWTHGTTLIEEGVAEPPNPFEQARETRYRAKVRAAVLVWRLSGKL